ncbi:uncharacterized protein MKK02DRAFT_39486 [Dioszegia hungarica]|uniref:Uncharacterized protein n=1 Tax=Dioszegia hungarica TaxID=4972 RepID=A0AA38LX35_9TREE|nr:uncharacterized protein MKK02DRAFT_39486 [Dioszegia hungarica]KAI9639195.1 hypothetical protein MKK02DRAFT_39486 [Dioszegia hungarica]
MTSEPRKQLVPQLLPELYPLIIQFLGNPDPAPLSQAPASCSKQPHLAVAMRVNRTFYKIAERLLYTHITIDHLLMHLVDLTRFRKEGRFALTKTMRVEYPEFGLEPTYTMMARNEGKQWRQNKDELWKRWGMMGAQKQQSREHDYARQLELLAPIFARRDLVKLGTVMPGLKAVAIASISGPQHTIWSTLRPARLHVECGQHFHRFLTSGNVEQTCVRDLAGYLAPPRHRFPPSDQIPGTRPLITLHFDSSEVDLLAFPPRIPTQWVYEGEADADWADVLQKLGAHIREITTARQTSPPLFPDEILNLRIYCSTAQTSSKVDADTILFNPSNLRPRAVRSSSPRPLSHADQADLAKELQHAVKWFVLCMLALLGTPVHDKVRWHTSAETPECTGCGCGSGPQLGAIEEIDSDSDEGESGESGEEEDN